MLWCRCRIDLCIPGKHIIIYVIITFPIGGTIAFVWSNYKDRFAWRYSFIITRTVITGHTCSRLTLCRTVFEELMANTLLCVALPLMRNFCVHALEEHYVRQIHTPRQSLYLLFLFLRDVRHQPTILVGHTLHTDGPVVAMKLTPVSDVYVYSSGCITVLTPRDRHQFRSSMLYCTCS
jgi:hypothetical protein